MSDFDVDFVGDLDFEQFVADIYYQGQRLAIMSQEEGPEKMQVEIRRHPDGNCWLLPLNEFMEVLQRTKKRLIEYRD